MDQQFLFFLLILIISGSASVAWKMKTPLMVTASRGEDAVLNCSVYPDRLDYSDKITVKWAKSQAESPFFECSVRNDTLEGPHDCSVLKYSLFGDPRRGELSLLITNVQLNDGGTFFCKVELVGNRKLQDKIQLDVKAPPHILSLSVVNSTCGHSSSASRWLICEVEGHPVPKVVWLSASKRLLENQGHSFKSGEWSLKACIPYLQQGEEVVTCRAENSEDHAERSFPDSNTLTMFVIVVSAIALMLLCPVFICILIICLRNHRQRRLSDPPADGAELQPVYSEISCESSLFINTRNNQF
ncbi:PREDICTED: sialic acid-binding Ig-like lectin 15 [Cyprinodon variegatus]|uniref:Sialic acid-binding Ig-like lectin 15 n=1 Tax=Cyprinodon variegatus TaxID=28743 RepID=A0A3Q2E2Z8_CYPVA|nr:PREDICTED: sialic acid-binding Ig-like lectin 15 [Cyprinodon variegatus]